MNKCTIISNKSRLRPINKPKYCADICFYVRYLHLSGQVKVPCYVITYSNHPETKLHHVIKLDQ